MGSFCFPIDQHGVFQVSGIAGAPGHKPKKATKRAALFHAMCVADSSQCKFASSLKANSHLCLQLSGARDYSKAWATMRAFQEEALITSGKGSDHTPQLRLGIRLMSLATMDTL